MIKNLKNITNETLSIPLPGRAYEIPAGWSLSDEDIWGGEETLRYIAIRLAGSVRAFDAEGNEVLEVECPCCKNKVQIAQPVEAVRAAEKPSRRARGK